MLRLTMPFQSLFCSWFVFTLITFISDTYMPRIRMLFRYPFEDALESHVSHSYLTPICYCLCPEFLWLGNRFCFEFALYSHWLQSYINFLCVICLWCPSFEFDVALWSHWSQPNTSPSCTLRTWVLRLPVWLVLKSHSSQWYHKSWWVLLMCDFNMVR